MKSKINIIVAVHKESVMPEDNDLYIPIHLGSYNKNTISNYIRDDSGDNISQKNPYYCELTGLYWAWKNLKCDYLGLVHYRRYLSSMKLRGNINTLILNRNNIENLLKDNDIIVPQKRNYYIETLYSHYSNTFSREHLDLSRKLLLKLFPEYILAFDKVMKQRDGYMFNMFIMEKRLSDRYCEWLFIILDKLYENINLDGYSDFEKRLFGRVSEILFNVWVEHNKFKVVEVPVIYIGKINWINKIISFLLAKFFKVKYKKSF